METSVYGTSFMLHGRHFTIFTNKLLPEDLVVTHLWEIAPAKTQTIFTVPPHVGENVEVPKYCKVTYYDPEEREAI